MSAGNAIPLKIRSDAPAGPASGLAMALGHEILAHLDQLLASGEPGALDLKSMPMSPADYRALRSLLGEGEIDLTLELDGPTRIRETAFPGVWWIQHRDAAGTILAENIEINRVPQFLQTPGDAVEQSADLLRSRLKGEAE